MAARTSCLALVLALVALCSVTGSAHAGPAFKKYKDCASCTAAGFGWSLTKNKCGGYGNHACPGAAAKAAPKPPPPVKPKAAKAPKRKPGRAGKAGKAASAKYSAPPMSEVDVTKSVDMSSKFAMLLTCQECVTTGGGWCPIARMCGGFDNSVCQGDDTDYAREESEQKEWLSKRNINKQEL